MEDPYWWDHLAQLRARYKNIDGGGSSSSSFLNTKRLLVHYICTNCLFLICEFHRISIFQNIFLVNFLLKKNFDSTMDCKCNINFYVCQLALCKLVRIFLRKKLGTCIFSMIMTNSLNFNVLDCLLDCLLNQEFWTWIIIAKSLYKFYVGDQIHMKNA